MQYEEQSFPYKAENETISCTRAKQKSVEVIKKLEIKKWNMKIEFERWEIRNENWVLS